MSNLTELTPFPTRPENEVPRDNLVVQIAGDFNANCPKQAVTGEPLTGKTNLLAQFASYYSERCLSYFITDDPWTQRQYTFLYNLCNQLCVLLQEPPPPIAIDLENLKSQFAALGTKLNRKAQKTKTSYFFVIDGLEWGIEGVEGDRIIDVLPQTFPISPYLLYSCQTSKIDMLPKHLKLNHVIKPLSFSVSETGSFLAELGYSTEEIKKLHKRHQGNPGSLKAVYDAKKSDPGFSLESALQEYDQMIEQQIKFLMDTVPDSVQKSLAFLSASPTGLSLAILADLIKIDRKNLLNLLNDTLASICDIRSDRIDFSNETIRKIYGSQIKNTKKLYLDELLDFIKTYYPNEEFLLTRLYIEAKDYKGLQNQLSPRSILSTVDNPSNGVSSVIQRLRSASRMACEEDDYDGLIRWSLGISTIKSYIEHSMDHDEIKALIAIGESEEALRKAYFLPDLTNRIRFLARTYSAMKSRNERVSKEAKEELIGFINTLRIDELDTEVVQGLAIDIFPILPDISVSLLDAVQIESNKNGVVDLFAMLISEQFKQASNESKSGFSDKALMGLTYHEIFSHWLDKTSLVELETEINSIETTEAKEQLVRYWCNTLFLYKLGGF